MFDKIQGKYSGPMECDICGVISFVTFDFNASIMQYA
jgi:hypothetical protein